MIELLRVKNLAVIEEASLELERGFIVLTGETGAGKSIIIGSLKALTAGKGDPDLIRTGEEKAKIEAAIDGKIFALEISKKRTRAYIEGELAPLKKLSDFASRKIDIFGQRDHRFLLQPENHLLFLDNFLGIFRLREEVKEAWEKYIEIKRKLENLEKKREEIERKKDFLSFQIEEIAQARLSPGEEEELLKKREIILKRERIKELLSWFLSQMEAEGGLNEKIWELKRNLEELSQVFPDLTPYVEESESFYSSLSDLARFISEKSSMMEEETSTIEEVESRLALIEKLKRKYGKTIEEILEFKERAEQELESLKSSFDMEKLKSKVKQAWDKYVNLAKTLSQKRREGKERLEKEALKKLRKLAMEKAILEFQIKESEPYEFGLERGEILFTANPGESLKPLRKVASGGELSRVMLALKSLFTEEGKTFVFDEIDAGIGGRVASTLGKMLKEISEKNQVIVVTHLPQVASFANQHFVVEKEIKGGRTYTKVREVKGEERTKEIARMLAGEETPSALKSAEELLKKASTS